MTLHLQPAEIVGYLMLGILAVMLRAIAAKAGFKDATAMWLGVAAAMVVGVAIRALGHG